MRRLALRKETLAELTAEELDGVVGAAQEVTKTSCICSDFASCLPTYDCPTRRDCVASLGGC